MIRLAADENFKAQIIRGLIRRHQQIDIVRIQDVGLQGAADPEVLEWAANQGRILLSHDVVTLPDAAYSRVARGMLMPGVFLVP